MCACACMRNGSYPSKQLEKPAGVEKSQPVLTFLWENKPWQVWTFPCSWFCSKISAILHHESNVIVPKLKSTFVSETWSWGIYDVKAKILYRHPFPPEKTCCMFVEGEIFRFDFPCFPSIPPLFSSPTADAFFCIPCISLILWVPGWAVSLVL